MEFDIVNIVTTIGIPAAITFFLLWKLIPAVNGLKDVVKDLVGVVEVDSANIANMKDAVDMNTSQVIELRLAVSKLNGKQ